ncbi:unnamed protein product, partial [Mesorhabditis spiculigera]
MPQTEAREGTSQPEERLEDVELDEPPRPSSSSSAPESIHDLTADAGPLPEKPPRSSSLSSDPTGHGNKAADMQHKLPEPAADFVPHQRKSTRMDGMSWRYVVLGLTVLALSSVMANIVAFNFTVLCMPATDEPTNRNGTYEGYTKHDRTWLFSAVALGALCAVVPTSMLISRFGTRKIFFAAGLLSALATLFTPFAARSHLLVFVALRFVQGISFAACMPVVGAVTSAWSPLGQAGLFMSALTAFGQLSAVFSNPLSGQLCASPLGWSSVFYLHGGLALAIFTAWFLVYRDDPENHSLVSRRELAEIRSGKNEESYRNATKEDEEVQKIPYFQILSTPSVWGVWAGALGDLIAIQLIHTFSPLYIKTVLDFSMEKTGWSAALPVLFQFIVKVLAGHSSDRIHGISETTKLRIYNSIALGASAAFMIVLAFVPKGHPTLGMVLITLTTSMFGFNGGGFNKCAALVSRQYSHFVLANIQFLWCLAMLICPVLVGLLLHKGSVEEWRTIFILHAVILLVTNGIFCLLATAKPATWTDKSIKSASKRRTPWLRLV